MKLIDSPYGLSLTQERRRDRRRKTDSVLYLNIEPDNGGVVLDLSEGGMCISVANPLAKSDKIQFSLGIEENRPIEGTGQVSWLSESGRSAGVRFLFFPDESRQRIREWMAGTGASEKKVEPRMAGANDGERRDGPQTPLFFLPRNQEAGEVSPDEYSWQPPAPSWYGEKTEAERNGETVVAFRSAITSTTEPDEQASGEDEDRRFKKFLFGVTICFALLAVGVAAIVAYPNKFSQLRQFAASLAAPPVVTPAAPAEAPMPRRIRRGAAARRESTGPQRGRHPVRDIATFEAPRQGGLTTDVTDSSQRSWLATASGRRLVPEDGEQPARPAAAPVAPSLPGNSGAALAAKGAGSKATTIVASEPEQMGGLRVDGGLVEEGSVTPTFAPLNLDGQALASKPIVVQAVIGKDGEVEDVRLVSSQASQLAQAIVSAVKLWRYRPFYRNGQPIEFVTRITFNFSLPNAESR
jgi:TonB family protein